MRADGCMRLPVFLVQFPVVSAFPLHFYRKVKVEPPAEWGRHWSWNVTEDGSGIYFRRNFA